MKKALLVIAVALAIPACGLDGGATYHNAAEVNAASWRISFDDWHVARSARPGAAEQACDPGCECTFAPAVDFWDVDGSESVEGYKETCANRNTVLSCSLIFENADSTTASCLEYPIGQDPIGNSNITILLTRE